MRGRCWIAGLLVLGLVTPVAAQPVAEVEYCSYVGGSYSDLLKAVWVGHGMIVTAGQTTSLDYPITPGVWREEMPASYYTDGIITVFDATGHTLLASTYFGGSKGETINDVTGDAAGNIYVVGQTYSDDIPGTTGAFQPSPGVGAKGFVGSLSPDLRVLRWFTYVDSEGNWDEDADVTRHVIHDPAGYVYAAGYVADHATFPATGQLLPDPGGTYVLKLDDRDGSLVWLVDIGKMGIESIALSPEGNVILGGSAYERVPLSEDAFQTENNGYSSHYILCLEPDGTFRWGTYIGGMYYNFRLSAVAATADHVYFAGMTSSPDYPVRGTSWGSSYHGGSYDVVVGSLSGGGRILDWCGYLGGAGSDGYYSGEGVGFRCDDRGHLILYTSTNSPDLPVTPDAYQDTYNGSLLNGLMASVGEDGALRWVSYFGGPEGIGAWDMALLPGRLIGTGSAFTWDSSTVTGLPVTPDALSDTLQGMKDGYLFILHTDDIVPTLVQSGELTWESGTAVLRWRLSGNATDLRAEVVAGGSVRPLPLTQAPDGTWTARDEQACVGEAGPRTYRLVQPEEDHWMELWRRTVTPECPGGGSLRLVAAVGGSGLVRLTLESPAAGTARVALYDLAGRRVADLPARTVDGGASVTWEWHGRGLGGERLAAGRYLARCRVGDRSTSASVLLVR